MRVLFGAIIVLLSGFGFIGQFISAFWPLRAQKLGLMEEEKEVDPTFFADIKGEAAWDAVILWILPLSGVLLMLGNPLWAHFGLIGGGTFLYFSGRGIFVRVAMLRREIRIGPDKSFITAVVFLSLWAILAILVIILAIADPASLGM